MKLWLGAVALTISASSGCVVWQSTYDELQHEFDEYKAKAEARQKENP